MSSLWDVEILNRGAKWVDLVVTLHHPDAGPFPESPGFALQLLLVPAYGYDESYNLTAKSPLGAEFSETEFYDAETVEERADKYISSVRIYQAVNVPFVEKTVHAGIDKRVLARGIKKKSAAWQPAWDDEWRAYWADPTRVPSARYRIEVKDPRWVEHLSPGLIFDTASWCPSGPWVNQNRDESLPTPPDAILSPWLVGFQLAEVPRGERMMDAQMIENLASAGPSLAGAELEAALAAHKQFLDAGNREGNWQLLSVSGLPLCIYQADGEKVGQQLVLRMKQIAEGESARGKDVGFADLSGCICRGVDFREAKLDGCAAVDSYFDRSHFDGASLRLTDFSGSSLKGCSFVGADLRGSDFEHTDLTGANFTNANITGARFPGAILDGVCRNGVIAPTPARIEPKPKAPNKTKTAATKAKAPAQKKAPATAKSAAKAKAESKAKSAPKTKASPSKKPAGTAVKKSAPKRTKT